MARKKKFTAKQKTEFEEQFNYFRTMLWMELREWQHLQLQVLSNTPLTDGFDIKSFAIESFIHKINSFHDVEYEMEAALQETKYLINP